MGKTNLFVALSIYMVKSYTNARGGTMKDCAAASVLYIKAFNALPNNLTLFAVNFRIDICIGIDHFVDGQLCFVLFAGIF